MKLTLLVFGPIAKIARRPLLTDTENPIRLLSYDYAFRIAIVTAAKNPPIACNMFL